ELHHEQGDDDSAGEQDPGYEPEAHRSDPFTARGSRGRGLADPAALLCAPALAAPREIDERDRPPHVVQLPVAEVLDDRVAGEAKDLARPRVPPERELLQSERRDGKHDAEEERDDEEAD